MESAYASDARSPSVKAEPAASMNVEPYARTARSRAGTMEPNTPLQPIHSSLINMGDAWRSSQLVPMALPSAAPAAVPAKDGEDAEEEDEEGQMLAEDEFTAHQYASQLAKANLKVLMDNFSDEQQERYHWYRRSTLNKGSIKKLLSQSLGQNASLPVSQLVGGVAKVFVGEIVEKALEAQALRGEEGPLSPEHIREAYSQYKDQKGSIGAARPLRGKRLAL